MSRYQSIGSSGDDAESIASFEDMNEIAMISMHEAERKQYRYRSLGTLVVAVSAMTAVSVAVAGTVGNGGVAPSGGVAQRGEASHLASEAPNEKVVFGQMAPDDVHALFAQFKATNGRNYEDDAIEADRFSTFKKNLAFIDSLNVANPHALYGVTRFADFTEDERNSMRMTDPETTSWAKMKAKLASFDAELAEAGEAGLDAVAALQGTRDAERRARRALTGAISAVGAGEGAGMGESWKAGVDSILTGATAEFDMSQGEASWVSDENCAACNLYPSFGDYNMGSLPTNFDWRELGAVTSVKNQAYCGSCWSFSTAADLEGTHYLETGVLTSLAPQQLVECSTANYGCDGGFPFVAMQYLEHVGGLVHWAEMPYKAICAWDACGQQDVYYGTPTCHVDELNTQIKTGNVSAIGGWQMVAMGAEYEELMRVALVKNGPISIAFNANGMDYYIHGVMGCSDATGYCEAGAVDHHMTCDPTVLDHAVLMVGYGTQEDLPYWVIKNRCAPLSPAVSLWSRARGRPPLRPPSPLLWETAPVHRATRTVALPFERCFCRPLRD